MNKEYLQTELEIEVAKKALEELCEKYEIPCTVLLGTQKAALAFTNDNWLEVMSYNVDLDKAIEFANNYKRGTKVLIQLKGEIK